MMTRKYLLMPVGEDLLGPSQVCKIKQYIFLSILFLFESQVKNDTFRDLFYFVFA